MTANVSSNIRRVSRSPCQPGNRAKRAGRTPGGDDLKSIPEKDIDKVVPASPDARRFSRNQRGRYDIARSTFESAREELGQVIMEEGRQD